MPVSLDRVLELRDSAHKLAIEVNETQSLLGSAQQALRVRREQIWASLDRAECRAQLRRHEWFRNKSPRDVQQLIAGAREASGPTDLQPFVISKSVFAAEIQRVTRLESEARRRAREVEHGKSQRLYIHADDEARAERELIRLQSEWQEAFAGLRARLLSYLEREGIREEDVDRGLQDRVSSATRREDEALEALKSRLAELVDSRAIADAAYQESVDQLNVAPFVATDSIQVRFRQPALGPRDMELVDLWESLNLRDGPRRPGLCSARKAELLAQQIYGDGAVDLSIKQLSHPTAGLWKYADLMVGRQLIDIKNARRSLHAPNDYSRHTVQRLKCAGNQEVRLSAFLSPYDKTEAAYPVDGEVVWLGEISATRIDQLRSEFSSSYLSITLKADRDAVSARLRIPPWLFDLPSAFYAERDEAIRELRSLGQEHADLVVRPVTQQLLSLIEPASGAHAPEAKVLAGRISRLGLSRPVLWLHVLDRWCHALHADWPSPIEEIGRLLGYFGAAEDCEDGPLRRSVQLQVPVSDPLNCIAGLLQTLAAVDAASVLELRSFESFNLTRDGILRGLRRSSGWATILAYCGGLVSFSNGSQAACGRSPLHLGMHASCPRCGYLVCDKCDTCKYDCDRSS